jgi:hypothetical protein
VFTFFEMVNQTYAKMFYEPQRCQFVSWTIVYKFMTNQDYKEALQQRVVMKSSVDSGFNMALILNPNQLHPNTTTNKDKPQTLLDSPCGKHKKKKRHDRDSSGIYSEKSGLSDEDSDEDEEEEDEYTQRKGSPKQADQMSF